MTAILQVAGAILLLAGFVAAQVGALRDTSLPYLTINMAGAACLAVLAMLAHDWGFLCCWKAVGPASPRQVRFGHATAPIHRRPSVRYLHRTTPPTTPHHPDRNPNANPRPRSGSQHSWQRQGPREAGGGDVNNCRPRESLSSRATSSVNRAG
jgi:hypothetical protein